MGAVIRGTSIQRNLFVVMSVLPFQAMSNLFNMEQMLTHPPLILLMAEKQKHSPSQLTNNLGGGVLWWALFGALLVENQEGHLSYPMISNLSTSGGGGTIGGGILFRKVFNFVCQNNFISSTNLKRSEGSLGIGAKFLHPTPSQWNLES